MTSKHFVGLGLLVGLVGMGAASTGCGGGGNNGTGGSSSSTATASSSKSVVASSGSGGASGNHSFATATSINIDDPATMATLVDEDMTKDFYTFTGKAGDRIVVSGVAQGLVTASNGNDPTIADLVVTLFDTTMTQIAQDDDGWPRFSTDSQLYTVLPADGDYYLSVQECHAAFTSGCGTDGLVTNFDYTLFVGHTDMLNHPESNESGTTAMPVVQDGTKAHDVVVTYTKTTTAGQYFSTVIDGNFTTSGNADVFSFTPPADTSVQAGQEPRAYFWVQPIGPNNGDGSTQNAKVWITTAADPTTILAQVDEKNYSDGDNQTDGPIELAMPIGAAPYEEYLLFVARSGSTTAATDFYFVEHQAGTIYLDQDEMEGPTATGLNDDPGHAETLMTPAMATAGSFYVEGYLSSATDVDFYKMGVPTGSVNVDVFCSAERAGSGLRGFTFVLSTDGTAGTQISTGTEAANLDLAALKTPLTGTPAQAFLKVSATSQDTMVTGNYYNCAVVFNTM